MNFRSTRAIIFISVFGCTPATLQAADALKVQPHPFGDREHIVLQSNGEHAPTTLAAEMHWISEAWLRQRDDENAQMPYLVYMPERDRIAMLVITHHPTHTALIFSDDHGKTWSNRKWFQTDEEGHPKPGIVVGLTYLGDGKLLVHPDNVTHGRWLSTDFGETWTFSTSQDSVDKRYVWDPYLVITNAKEDSSTLYEASYRPTGVAWGSPDGSYSQGYFRSSTDEGQSWSAERKIPQWLGVNEIALLQATNGNLIAACRTDYPARFAHHKLDHFGGLAVSISKDNGHKWSEIDPLYEWGRHHPCMVRMRNGVIVMSYVVRLGLPATHHGRPQFGVEAVVSRDHGQTWDKEHRYILAKWTGNITGSSAWFCSVQSTSTILLPDGMLLTAFGTGFRNPPDARVCKMDVAMVRWQLNPADSEQ